MANTDRRGRNQRTTALTCGLMAEVVMGTALLVWSSSSSAGNRAVFGPGGSIGIVVTAMVLLAVAMVVIGSMPRPGRKVSLTAVAMVSLAGAGVGVIAVATLFTDPGIGFLLGFGWALTIPVTLAITRGNVASGRAPRSE
ncbi:MAG: hypothetical protein ACRDRX_21545 [Pseudonocardiaceae bacterium]